MYYGERPQMQQLNRNITEMYSSLSNWTQEAIETMEIAGYYVMTLQPGLKVMSINSNFGYATVICIFAIKTHRSLTSVNIVNLS